jgi:hypothetical protein
MFKKLAIAMKINFETALNKECCIKIKSQHRSFDMNLPIKKIDNNNVRVYFHVFRNYDATQYGIELKIRTKIDFDLGEQYEKRDLYHRTIHLKKELFELEDYEKAFMEIYELLPKLKINKLTNCFDTQIHFDDEELTLLCSHTNTESNECCVCKELTGDSFILCGHILCIECCGNLKHSSDDDCDDDEFYIHCPMCRIRIGN